MIKKLKTRVRLSIQIPLFLLMALIAGTFLYLNYLNIISDAASTINRFAVSSNDSMNDIAIEKAGQEQLQGDDLPPAKPSGNDSGHSESAHHGETDNPEDQVVYEFSVSDGELTYQSTDDRENINVALSLAHGDERNGVSSGLFYRLQKTGEQSYNIKLMKSDSLYSSFNRANLTALGIFVIGCIVIIILSLLISKFVIKPVAENEKKQKTFITDTSHELKTPLAVMQANAEVLQSEIGENKWLGYINNETVDMEGLMGSLLLLSQSEQESEKEAIREFDVSEKAALLISVYESHALERGITVDTDIQPNVSFTGSEYDLENIISPLFDNALRYTPDKGHIRFSLAKQRKKLVITVQNEGEPITPEDREKIFDRFYRVDKARSRGEKHYGLGLAIVKATAEKYRGSVSVDCAGGVTTFMVKLKKR